jgi:bile acid:Na+ symporter, BASS family
MNPETIVATVMMASLTFGAGLQVNRDRLIAILKNYSLLGRALLANFVIVPILGVLFVRLFHLETYIATGVLVMTISPGAIFVILGARKKGGSLGFADALAFIMPALATLTIPLTAALILPADEAAQLPVLRFLMTLVLLQLAPLIVGYFVSDRAPTLAAKLERPVNLIFLATLVALVALVYPTLAKSVASVYGSHGMWAMLCIVVLSVAAGWTLGGPDREDRRTLSIGTAIKKVGLGALVATTSFPRTEVLAAVLTYFAIQLVVSTLLGMYYKRTAASPAGIPA